MTVDRFQIAKMDLRADDIVVITTQRELSTDDCARLLASWEAAFKGRPFVPMAIVLDHGMQVERLRTMTAMTPADVGLDDRGKFL